VIWVGIASTTRVDTHVLESGDSLFRFQTA
jgi:hypothetical protein